MLQARLRPGRLMIANIKQRLMNMASPGYAAHTKSLLDSSSKPTLYLS
jgi:hypothetical protein